MTGTSEDRDLVARISHTARKGDLDAAADLLADALDAAYQRGYRDGFGEGRDDQ